jgi:hypothetical protein
MDQLNVPLVDAVAPSIRPLGEVRRAPSELAGSSAVRHLRAVRRATASRPIEASKAAICNGRFTSIPAVRFAQIAVVADGSLPAQCGSLCVISTGAQRTLVLSTWGTAVVRAFRIVADAGPLAARREPPVPAAAHGRAMAEAVHGPPAAVAPDVAAGHERPAALG